MEPFLIKQNDTLPYLEATLFNEETPVDLTGATAVYFVMRAQCAATPHVRRLATLPNAAGGVVRYLWQAGDTAGSGQFRGEFEVQYGGSNRATYPSTAYIPITVLPDLDQ